MKTEISLMVIKSGRLDFIGEVFKFASEWAEENYPDDFCGVRNTPDGFYEILLERTED